MMEDHFQTTLRDARAALEATLAVDGTTLSLRLRTWRTPPPLGAFVIGDGILLPRDEMAEGAPRVFKAVFMLRDSADSLGYGMPYRAKLSQDRWNHPAGGWLVEAIESQCLSCFGAGVVEREVHPCDTCGAVGWGLREVLTGTWDVEPRHRARKTADASVEQREIAAPATR